MGTKTTTRGHKSKHSHCGREFNKDRASNKYDNNTRNIDIIEHTGTPLLVGCLLGEQCSSQTLHLPQYFSVKLQLHQGSTHRHEHDWPLRAPDMEE